MLTLPASLVSGGAKKKTLNGWTPGKRALPELSREKRWREKLEQRPGSEAGVNLKRCVARELRLQRWISGEREVQCFRGFRRVQDNAEVSYSTVLGKKKITNVSHRDKVHGVSGWAFLLWVIENRSNVNQNIYLPAFCLCHSYLNFLFTLDDMKTISSHFNSLTVLCFYWNTKKRPRGLNPKPCASKPAFCLLASPPSSSIRILTNITTSRWFLQLSMWGLPGESVTDLCIEKLIASRPLCHSVFS